MPKRMLLDATKTFECRFSTGIQRVVRELVRRSDLIGAALGVEVIPVVTSSRGYHRLDAAGLTRLLDPPAATGGAIVAHSRLARRAKEVLQSNMRVYATMQRLSMRRRMAALTANLEPIDVTSDDIVALIDDFAGGSPSLGAIAKARRTGATTIAIVYDLIPILHPEMVPRPIAYLFKRTFEKMAGRVDGLIAISKSGADLIRAQPAVLRSGVPVSSFYLGQDLHVARGNPASTTIPEDAWHGGPTFIMVGSIEPRKRHAAALAAFSSLWEDGVAANLLMVGRVGWDVDAFIHETRRHVQFGKSLFLCHDVGDNELRDAMARADATIMASKAEGFGLPIVESLAFGVPVLASDIPIFREVAGEAGCYFPPDDINEFAGAIRGFIDNPEGYQTAARAFSWINWDGSASEFAETVRVLVNASEQSSPHERS
ncbi:glycosyltransferase family 1 protein [Sphingomonas sp. OK281]|uniref:glycosyltransferase family 4 protein n=1 Tax=Sphingomonas sp. OK281 TaxID=1881067 RepID=UPI0008F383B0|nr:glycosyltransferase family 1 protein [Sphingomonas sp. OK281]SFO11332.1 alpha-1,2-rhamnosyltransferase [Sphingomonas sp. OK281]